MRINHLPTQNFSSSPDKFYCIDVLRRKRMGLRMRNPISVQPMQSRSYFAATFAPACSIRVAALSVASQVNSGSVRPKCPYAAVFW